MFGFGKLEEIWKPLLASSSREFTTFPSNTYSETLTQTEDILYGSSRLGMEMAGKQVVSGYFDGAEMTLSFPNEPAAYSKKVVGKKRFELSNHLGNVLAVITDHKMLDVGALQVDHFTTDVTTASEYYPFGMQMPGRSFSSESYRYGFNSWEKDDEISGSGNHLSFGDYGCNPRIAKRWNVDPITKEQESPYASFGNSPLWLVDHNGLDTLVVHRSRDFQLVGKTKLYTLTFSVIQDGVQTQMQDAPKMWLLSNAEAEKKGDNGLTRQSYYTMKMDNMSHSDGKAREIRVTSFGVFIHSGNTVGNFGGCMGITCLPPVVPWNNNGETYEAAIMASGDRSYGEQWFSGITDTKNYGERDGDGNIMGGLMTMWGLYDQANGVDGASLTGDKFLLQPNSEAPMSRIEPISVKQISTSSSSEKTLQTR